VLMRVGPAVPLALSGVCVLATTVAYADASAPSPAV